MATIFLWDVWKMYIKYIAYQWRIASWKVLRETKSVKGFLNNQVYYLGIYFKYFDRSPKYIYVYHAYYSNVVILRGKTFTFTFQISMFFKFMYHYLMNLSDIYNSYKKEAVLLKAITCL